MKDLKIELLALEFKYAQDIAKLAMSDRHKIINFFTTFFGIIFSGVFGILNFSNLVDNEILFTILFSGFVIGFIFLMNIIRLRQSWHEAILVMNSLKEYIFKKTKEKDFENAFLWKKESTPSPHKGWTIFFFSAVLIAFLNSLLLGFAFAISDNNLTKGSFLFFTSFSVEIFLYLFILKKNA